MNSKFSLIIFFTFISMFGQDSLYLELPQNIYLSSDNQFSIYFNNLISGSLPDNYTFEVNCNVGYIDSLKYNLDSLNLGSYQIEVQIKDSLGKILEKDSSNIFVSDHSIQFEDTLRVLLIGDSYTNTGVYVFHLKDIYNNSSSTSIKFLGTRSNTGYPYYGADNGLYHEGYWGKTWNWFANDISSPFVFDVADGIDIDRYLNESLKSEIPDLVTIFLGVNDISSADPSSIGTIDNKIDEILGMDQMQKVVNSIINCLPNVKIGIILTTPTNEREYTYTDTTQLNYSERKLCLHRLVQRYIDYYENLNITNINLIPAYINIDTFLGFGETDPLHPAIYGYRQIAFSIYGWIKYNISQWVSIPSNIQIEYNDAQIELSWDLVRDAYQYNIYRALNPYGEYEFIATTETLYYIDTEIPQNDKCFYKITAENGLK
ncbi:MAG: hypothetical protein GQ534_09990 [Candidatus Delongbacteria bacterium]|nr:hypothetical protein [Candidatus Delongbacteria bacterium]